jgi:iron complex outermembrane receptor protein
VIISYVGQAPKFFTVTVGAGETIIQNADLTEVTDLSGVVVLGSRSRVARSKLSTPVPVDVIQSRELKQFPQTDLTQALTYTAPSFQSSRQTISDGTDHIDPAGLRGLGPDQTLVLMNGKRRHNTALVNINGTVGRGSVGTDLNAIPLAAVDRVEILRDGASAQYGSDAIAGVINVVLKKNYNGLSFSGMAGQNFTNMPYNGGQNIQDGLNRQVDFTWGMTGKKQNQFLVLSGQWLKRDASNRSGDDNIPLVYMGNGGAFPATQTGVNPVDYRRWLINYDDSIANGRGYNRHNIVAGNSSSENLTLFLNAGTPITDRINCTLPVGVSNREGGASGFSRNPNSMSQQPVKADGQRYYYDGFLPEIHSLIMITPLSLAFSFPFQNDGDLSYTRGQNGFNFYIENTLVHASMPPTDDAN